MTRAQSKRIEILRAKVQAGVPIKESEWLSWQRAPRSTKYEDTRLAAPRGEPALG